MIYSKMTIVCDTCGKTEETLVQLQVDFGLDSYVIEKPVVKGWLIGDVYCWCEKCASGLGDKA